MMRHLAPLPMRAQLFMAIVAVCHGVVVDVYMTVVRNGNATMVVAMMMVVVIMMLMVMVMVVMMVAWRR